MLGEEKQNILITHNTNQRGCRARIELATFGSTFQYSNQLN